MQGVCNEESKTSNQQRWTAKAISRARDNRWWTNNAGRGPTEGRKDDKECNQRQSNKLHFPVTWQKQQQQKTDRGPCVNVSLCPVVLFLFTLNSSPVQLLLAILIITFLFSFVQWKERREWEKRKIMLSTFSYLSSSLSSCQMGGPLCTFFHFCHTLFSSAGAIPAAALHFCFFSFPWWTAWDLPSL